MKKRIVLALLLFSSLQIFSQAYMTAGGVRLGTDWGLTLQQRIGKSMTLEGILQSSLQREEVMVTGLIEKHYPVVFRGLNLYVGAGAHKGWINEEDTDSPDGADFEDPFGLSFVGGAELTLGRLNFSYDFKPAFNLTGGEKKFYSQTGVSIRYVLLK
ncbi:MAG: hypothetical protein AAB316_21150, partial [Bacteroidota bacterium]